MTLRDAIWSFIVILSHKESLEAKVKYQAIIIDLDGTLLNDQHQINANNIDAIKLALREGYQVTLASGRPHNLMLPYVNQLGVTAPIICCNGAYQYDPVKQRVNHSTIIETAQLTQLLDMLNLGQFYFTIYAQNGIYATQESAHFLGLKKQMEMNNAQGEIAIIKAVEELTAHCGDVYKVLVSSDDKIALCQLRDTLTNSLQADLSAPNKLDITGLGVNKGQATLCWLNQQNIAPKQTIAFGDGDNDAEMFRIVGEPVAMANASPALRGLANLIVTDNNGCGIGQYLRLVVSEGQHSCQHSFSY